MLPIIPKPAISQKQKNAAIAIAAISDFVTLVLLPVTAEGAASPIQLLIDFITALALMAVCGFKWQFIIAFLIELIPGFDLIPTWIAVALLLRTDGAEQRSSDIRAHIAPSPQSAPQFPPVDVMPLPRDPAKAGPAS